jgi:hypothetical protein
MRAGAVRSQRLAALAATLMSAQLAAVVNVSPLLAVTPVGSCLSHVSVVPSGAAEGVSTFTKSASTCTAQHSTRMSSAQEAIHTQVMRALLSVS